MLVSYFLMRYVIMVNGGFCSCFNHFIKGLLFIFCCSIICYCAEYLGYCAVCSSEYVYCSKWLSWIGEGWNTANPKNLVNPNGFWVLCLLCCGCVPIPYPCLNVWKAAMCGSHAMLKYSQLKQAKESALITWILGSKKGYFGTEWSSAAKSGGIVVVFASL